MRLLQRFGWSSEVAVRTALPSGETELDAMPTVDVLVVA